MDNQEERKFIPGYKDLEELALDLHWSWSHVADPIWKQLDADLWEITQNPWIILQTVSREKLQAMLDENSFRNAVLDLVQFKRTQDQSLTWFQKEYPNNRLTHIAYFSMEYMLSEALPIYSGGLGNVAGDQLKAASDLGVPVTAIGLLYQQGYFRQTITKEGIQEALYPYNDPGQLPIAPLRKSNGEWIRLKIPFPGWNLWIRTWHVKVGRVNLYLLDTNDAANFPEYRALTSELYGGGQELRIKQEILLGIGGWKLLEELKIEPEVCHLNEGHAAFAIIERIRSYMEKKGCSFEEALTVTRAGNLFTTHTAVPAGFDRFPPSLIEQYLGHYIESLGISFKNFLSLGRQNPSDDSELFNMAYLALRGCGACNGVSQLHGKVSRQIFEPLFPRWPENEIPVGSITNGIHVPSWDSKQADEIWTEMCGKERWNWPLDFVEKDMDQISDEQLWKMRYDARKSLIEYARNRLSRQLGSRGYSLSEVEKSKHLFDKNTLTLGFARRFATYKRPNMLLHDPERFIRILTNPKFPVQLILAGKAHPADKPGQELIKQWIQFIQREEVRPHVIFLSDYDMMLTERLVQGVDVWINTPRRPWEACGTSGMKVLANGGLNLSELDGWWVEAYSPDVGWAIGDGQERGNDPEWDIKEANQLYEILENEIIPLFYQRDKEGIPKDWLKKVRTSMSCLTPHYSANRTVRDYAEKYYLPCSLNYQKRTERISDLLNWKKELEFNWSKLRFIKTDVQTKENKHEFETHVYLNGIDPKNIKVELYSEGENGDSLKYEMILLKPLHDPHSYVFKGMVPASRPKDSYTPRIVPFFPDVSIPLEADYITWQK